LEIITLTSEAKLKGAMIGSECFVFVTGMRELLRKNSFLYIPSLGCPRENS